MTIKKIISLNIDSLIANLVTARALFETPLDYLTQLQSENDDINIHSDEMVVFAERQELILKNLVTMIDNSLSQARQIQQEIEV